MDSRNDDWIKKLMENDLSTSESETIKSDLSSEDKALFVQLEEIKSATDDFGMDGMKSKEDAWSGIMDKISEQSINSVTRTVPFYQNPSFVSWVAASLAILMGVYFFFDYFGEKHIYVPNSKTEAVILPDGSNAVVNAHSSLLYDEKGFMEERAIRLEGEAYFNVVEGSTFRVVTKIGEVKVLGTEFNVLKRGREFQVKCMSGEVTVALDNSSRPVDLIAGQATKLEGHFLKDPYLLEPDQMSAWQVGEFYYDADPLSLVLKEIERQFDVQIKVKDINNRYYTGHFSKDDLQEALRLVLDPMGLEYDIIDKRLVIVR